MNQSKSLLIVATLAVGGALSFVACQSSHDHSTHSHGSAAAKPYPLETCIVTDGKLDDHGQPYTFVHEGQEIQLCCDGCLEDFKRNRRRISRN